MQKRLIKYVRWSFIILSVIVLLAGTKAFASEPVDGNIKPKDIIFEHLQDAYWWHITTVNEHHISIYLPVIVYSSQSGLQIFSSSRIFHGYKYNGFSLAGDGKYAGKIV